MLCTGWELQQQAAAASWEQDTASLHTRMLDSQLSTVENSQKPSTSYGSGFGKIFTKCICCTDVDWSLPPEKL